MDLNNAILSKKLFTPGPLCVDLKTKQAMLYDLGSRDITFIQLIKRIRQSLLDIAEVNSNDYTSVILQGSGTFGVEAVFASIVEPSTSKVLILSGGAYGVRMTKICSLMGLNHEVLRNAENETVNLDKLSAFLQSTRDFTHVAVVHCETSTGVINQIEAIGQLVKQFLPKVIFIVDAMSSFGAIPINFKEAQIDYLVSSANKCLEGVPGFSFIIANRSHLESCRGISRSLCLDIVDQYFNMENTGQFRFTPPTHSLLAFNQALLYFKQSGGLENQAARYMVNKKTLVEGMSRLGFKEFLDPEASFNGYIITSFLYPKDKNFAFNDFYQRLNEKNQVIYPGKTTESQVFRIGCIGDIKQHDILYLIACIEQVLYDSKISVPVCC